MIGFNFTEHVRVVLAMAREEAARSRRAPSARTTSCLESSPCIAAPHTQVLVDNGVTYEQAQAVVERSAG